MMGIIAGFALEKQLHSYVLTLEIMGGTFLMDGDIHFRTFQDNKMTYMDVLRLISRNYEQADLIGKESLETTAIDFLIQYQETDWEFIQRITSHLGLVVTPAIEREGVIYYVGESNHFRSELPGDVWYTVKKSMNGLEYMVQVREVYGLWDLLTFGGNGGYVYRIHSEYRQGEYIHTYYLCSMENMMTGHLYNEKQTGSSFPATVTAVMQDMVQVKVINDENMGQEIAKWFPYATGYSSPDGPAWYCMPEVGDLVRLQIPDQAEEHSYVISAVHKETESDRKNPNHKSFKTKYGKELLFTPDTLELTNNQGSSIKIIDGEGIKIVSNKNISIQAGADMTLSSEKASLMIAGTTSVDVKQGGAGLHLDDNVIFSGGKFRIQ